MYLCVSQHVSGCFYLCVSDAERHEADYEHMVVTFDDGGRGVDVHVAGHHGPGLVEHGHTGSDRW